MIKVNIFMRLIGFSMLLENPIVLANRQLAIFDCELHKETLLK